MPTEFCSYTLLGEISRGATSVVYRARDAKGAVVALKVLARHLSNDAAARARFMVEPTQQPRGPHIVRMLDSGVCNGAPYFAMEFIDGSSFADVIRHARASGTTVAPEVVDRVIGDIAAALDAAHKSGIVHRDIKPSNILIRARDQQAFLMDFGLAQSLASRGMSVQSTIQVSGGTCDYIAPEQIQGGAVSPRADIYSLGVTVFEALAGRLPFNAEDAIVQMHKHLTEAPPILCEVNPGVSPQLSAAVMQALQKDPQARYASAGEFAKRIHKALAGAQVKRANGATVGILGGAAVVVAVIAGVIAVSSAPASKPVATPAPSATVVHSTDAPQLIAATEPATDVPAPIPTAPVAQATSTLAPFDTPVSDISDTTDTSGPGAGNILIQTAPLGIERWGKPTSPDGCSHFDDQHPVTRYEVLLTLSNKGSSPFSNWKVDFYGGHSGPLPKCSLASPEGSPIAAGGGSEAKFDVYVEGDVLTRVELTSADFSRKLCVDGKALTPCK
ncbi:MAG: protein kinase [Chloroflexi bacterium]|nr:protein kinase [Chloroflexota bacterium]MCL5275590.1 protein kinase [Chloroflexota bacterium]